MMTEKQAVEEIVQPVLGDMFAEIESVIEKLEQEIENISSNTKMYQWMKFKLTYDCEQQINRARLMIKKLDS